MSGTKEHQCLLIFDLLVHPSKSELMSYEDTNHFTEKIVK